MTNDAEIVALFESEDVIVDTWPSQVRKKLNVDDPLVSVGVATLEAGHSFVVTGIPGDGKSHLSLSVAERFFETYAKPLTSINPHRAQDTDFSQSAGVLLSDASTLEPSVIIEIIDDVRNQGKVALIAINEGPLQDLAGDSEFFKHVRDLSHDRDVRVDEAEKVRVIDLFGRQSIHSDFASKALQKILDNVSACPSCLDRRECPRIHGAKALTESPLAQQRLLQLIRVGSDATYRLTAREVWGILLALFYGQRCPTNYSGEGAFRDGLWWNRLYSSVGQAKLDQLIVALRDIIDPVKVARSSDADLWRGRGTLWESLPVTQTAPADLHLSDPSEALRAFEDVKRESFFFDESWDTSRDVMTSSNAGDFSQLIDMVMQGKHQDVISRIVEAINWYRSTIREDQEVVIARHNQFNMSKRVEAYISNERIAIEALDLQLPYAASVEEFPDAGFRPRQLDLSWREEPASPLVVDLEFWSALNSRRTTYVNRSQEQIDYALDLFFAAAPSSVGHKARFEVLIPSQKIRREYRLRRRDGERIIELDR